MNIGTIEKGDTFEIKILYEKGSDGSITCHVCTLDYEAWNGAYDIISQNMLEIEEWSDNSLRGSVDVDKAGVLVTSVPYERGWKLKVDGTEREIGELIGGVFVSTILDEGTHEIELTFVPPGIVAGAVISLVSILILAAYVMLRRRRLAKLNAMLQSDFQEAEEAPQEESDCNRI